MNIILRSSWQTINIGDIAHSPGALRVLTEGLPDCNFTLWASPNITDEVKKLINSRFPNVRILTKTPEYEDELMRVIDKSDMLIHGSSACFSAYNDVKFYRERTGKPFGVFGITFSKYDEYGGNYEDKVKLLNEASFVYFRDGKSLEEAKGMVTAPIKFGCDGAFGFDIVDEPSAEETMRKMGLTEGKFVCCIPRYRYTPYWKVYPNRPYNKERDELNKKMVESDIKPLIEAICKIVTNTDLKVLICPEDETQVALGKEQVYDKLPEDIKKRVAWKDSYWLTSEALGVYKKSVGLFGCEMHSPIICVGNGIPAIVARWREQTTKGYMWENIGLPEWLFNFDLEEDKKRFPDTCLEMVMNREESFKKAQLARNNAFSTYEDIVKSIKSVLGDKQ